ncbi:MAG: hypothetical protein LKF61_04615 [Eggerthellaceae bacterium]|nr:hypothetical protein [Eggerthellaceae bacterium]MCH4220630.1 hypothetical protein [Eggerthellaceae bacterium]
MTDKSENIQELCDAAAKRGKVLQDLVNDLSGSSRHVRQIASSALSLLAKENPERVAPYADAAIDALNRPEAQTRWECLDILTQLVALESRTCDKAVNGAEAALFDEESGTVRLAAMRFLCKLGATTENRSKHIWPLIDEAIQCYHGDLEFQEMLVAVIGFSAGKLDEEVKQQLHDRVQFDAKNGSGALKNRSQQIIDNLA